MARQTRGSGPELSYRGMAYCDVCGGRLEPGEMLAGIHKRCLTRLTKPRHRATRKAPAYTRERFCTPIGRECMTEDLCELNGGRRALHLNVSGREN
jgi:hypothetical protein